MKDSEKVKELVYNEIDILNVNGLRACMTKVLWTRSRV